MRLPTCINFSFILLLFQDYVNDKGDVAVMAAIPGEDESPEGSRHGSAVSSKRFKTKKKVTING